jgi:hypothetical protein
MNIYGQSLYTQAQQHGQIEENNGYDKLCYSLHFFITLMHFILADVFLSNFYFTFLFKMAEMRSYLKHITSTYTLTLLK